MERLIADARINRVKETYKQWLVPMEGGYGPLLWTVATIKSTQREAEQKYLSLSPYTIEANVSANPQVNPGDLPSGKIEKVREFISEGPSPLSVVEFWQGGNRYCFRWKDGVMLERIVQEEGRLSGGPLYVRVDGKKVKMAREVVKDEKGNMVKDKNGKPLKRWVAIPWDREKGWGDPIPLEQGKKGENKPLAKIPQGIPDGVVLPDGTQTTPNTVIGKKLPVTVKMPDGKEKSFQLAWEGAHEGGAYMVKEEIMPEIGKPNSGEFREVEGTNVAKGAMGFFASNLLLVLSTGVNPVVDQVSGSKEEKDTSASKEIPADVQKKIEDSLKRLDQIRDWLETHSVIKEDIQKINALLNEINSSMNDSSINNEEKKKYAVSLIQLLSVNAGQKEAMIEGSPLQYELLEINDRVQNILVKIGSPAVESLIEALKKPRERRAVRFQIIWVLGTIKDPSAIPTLIEVLQQDLDSTIREQAATQLGGMKIKQAIVPLQEALKDPDGSVRKTALKGLLEIGGPDAVAAGARKALKVGNRESREDAMKALGEYGNGGDLKLLEDVVNDKGEDMAVRKAALGAYNQIAIRGFEEVLNGNDPTLWLEAVGKLEEFKATDSLIKTMRQHTNLEIRTTAARALSSLADQKVLWDAGSLQGALDSEGDFTIRSHLVVALETIKRNAMEVINSDKPGDNKNVWHAFYALGYIGDVEVVQRLQEIVKNDTGDKKEGANVALNHIKERARKSLNNQEKPWRWREEIDVLAAMGDYKTIQNNIEICRWELTTKLSSEHSEDYYNFLIQTLVVEDEVTSQLAGDALVQQGEKGINHLRGVVIQDKSQPVKVRKKAVLLLGEIGGLEVVATLEEAAGDKDEGIRKAAQQGFTKLNERYDVSALNRIASNEQEPPERRQGALWLLGRRSGKFEQTPAKKSLRYALEDPDIEIRTTALHALGVLGDREGLRTASLNSKYPDVKEGAQTELKRLKKNEEE